jgi:DNA invertase Pin-like site-specific DNA recombinase
VSQSSVLIAAGCNLYLEKQAVDTNTPAGWALFQMLGLFAEFERAIIQERIHAGLARARAKGTKSGRPIGGRESTRRKRPQSGQRWQAARAFSRPRECGTGTSAVQRIRAEMARAN